MSTVSINLKPIAGFCIKSSTLQHSPNILDVIPIGHKVFVNIAWDPNVPAPPPGSEEVIQRAMEGEDVDELRVNPDGWYVPVIVSEGRPDKDKAGKPSLVFDCIYNTSVRSRTLTDPKFKMFLVELAIQRLEAQTSLVLSRQIGTPNIASKGKLLPRTVSVPSFMAGNSAVHRATATSVPKPLIEEFTRVPPKMNGILKSTSLPLSKANTSSRVRPTWSWSKEGDRLSIVISVPSLPLSVIAHAALDVEPRRFILNIPDFPVLDINLDLSDAEIISLTSSATSVSLHGVPGEAGVEPNNVLTLKRQRDLDVGAASAKWKISENVLIVTA